MINKKISCLLVPGLRLVKWDKIPCDEKRELKLLFFNVFGGKENPLNRKNKSGKGGNFDYTQFKVKLLEEYRETNMIVNEPVILDIPTASMQIAMGDLKCPNPFAGMVIDETHPQAARIHIVRKSKPIMEIHRYDLLNNLEDVQINTNKQG